jgi:hypothetical protein
MITDIKALGGHGKNKPLSFKLNIDLLCAIVNAGSTDFKIIGAL